MTRRRVRLAPLHWLLAGQSLLVVLLSINRLSSLTLGYALPNEGLRWVDLTNMLVWPFASVALRYGTLRGMPQRMPAHMARFQAALRAVAQGGVHGPTLRPAVTAVVARPEWSPDDARPQSRRSWACA